jgi:hypothetical protein
MTFSPRLLVSAACLAGLLVASACASSRPAAEDLPDVENRDDLVDRLRSLGYDVAFLSPALFTGSPDPVAAYRITQPDGEIFHLLAFSPDDYQLLRNNSALDFRPRTGLTDADVRYNPTPGAPSRVQPQIFRKGSVVVVFSNPRTDLYYDLEQLLGQPAY